VSTDVNVRRPRRAGWPLAVGLALLTSACHSAPSRGALSIAQARAINAEFTRPSFTPPPRTIEDVILLAHDEGGVLRHSGAAGEADAAPPAGVTVQALTDFYYKRAHAAERLGRAKQEIDDLTLALAYGRRGVSPVTRVMVALAMAEREGGNAFRHVAWLRKALDTVMDRTAPVRMDGWQFTVPRSLLASGYASIGDLEAARAALEVAERRWYEIRASGSGPHSGHGYLLVDRRTAIGGAHAAILNATGNYAEAEIVWRKTIALASTEPHLATDRDRAHAALAETLIHQDRLLEAENEARQAIIGAFANRGARSAHSAWMLRHLAWVLLEQGRFPEAETLARLATDSFNKAGTAQDSLRWATARADLARALGAQGRDDESLREYDEIRVALSRHPESVEHFFSGHVDYANLLLRRGSVDRALKMLTVALELSRRSLGDGHRETARVRAARAHAYALKGDVALALGEFAAATAVLSIRAPEDEAPAVRPLAADARLGALGAYVGLLADIKDTAHDGRAGLDATAEAFRIADAARGRAVQHALDASAVRAAAQSPALADVVREMQDTKQRIRALYDELGDAANGGDQQSVAQARKRLGEQRALLRTLRARVDTEFPAYAELTDPKAVTLERARSLLRPGEALIATLVTRDRTFVWAVSPSGPVAFAAAPIGAGDLEKDVATLRAALEPNAKTLGDIPEFDVAVAQRLYEMLLEPVRAGWHDARHLLVVAHGPLGQLPLGLLPTRRRMLPPESGLMFSNYREVPWLARTHAITMLPSVGSLAALRALPAGAASRRAFVGFGDPWFSRDQITVAPAAGSQEPRDAALTTRALRVTLRSARRASDWSQLGKLPPLPDTGAEIQAIAAATNANPDRDVFLGPRANETTVKTLDLAGYRIIAFATHALVAGDLPGLTQPALALSAPDIAGVDGDGVLTTDEILALRLNADWIVLSACNTAGGQGAGAEAVSGLGRAFFYAGARALLVSNWPVETTSARRLTTQLFRQRVDASRAEALWATLNWMIDHGELVDSDTGKAVFSYAHPIFWAPFTLVGDGGGAVSAR
jgi:CHAT domain-containing protein